MPFNLRAVLADRHNLLLMLLTGVGLGLRLYRLDHHALWADEANRLIWAAGHSVHAQLFGVTAAETAMRVGVGPWLAAIKNAAAFPPPLFAILMHPWLSLGFAQSDAFVRLPCALLSAAAVPLTYAAAKEILPTRAALYAAALLALTPLHVFWGQEFSYYPLAYCCVLISFRSYFRFLETRAVRHGVSWAIAVAVSVYAHTFCCVVLAGQMLALVVRRQRPPLWPTALAVLLLLPQIALMWPAVNELRHVTNGFTARPSLQAFTTGLASALVQPYLGEYTGAISPSLLYAFAALGAVFIGMGIWLLPSADQRKTLFVNAVGPFVLFAAGYAVSGANVFTWPRYYFFFGFSVSVCVAFALATRPRLSAPVLLALAIGAAVAHRHQYFDLVKEDWPSVARAIESVKEPTQPVFVQRYNLVSSLGRYLHADNLLFGLQAQSDVARVPAHALRHGGAWFVDVWTFNQAIDVDELKRHFAVCRRWEVPSGSWRMTLTHCDDNAGPDDAGGARVAYVEQGFFEGQRDGCLLGWVFSSAGLRELQIIRADGTLLTHTPAQGLVRADVAAAFANLPGELTSKSGFRVCMEEQVGDPTIELRVLAVRRDGSHFELNTAESLAMIRR